MYVRRLELVDFRSYERVEVDLDPGGSVLVGANGMGKTNLVEALGYVATLRSHRVATDAPLVRAGRESAVIRCAIVHDGRELLVELELVPGRANRARLGRSAVRRARDVLGALKLVLFAPEDLELVRGDPAERRRYLDDLLVTRQPRYAGVRADYDRVLKQRNALLRTSYLSRKARGAAADLSTLDVWDAHLARHGAQLVAGRLALVRALAPYVTRAYDAVAGTPPAGSATGAASIGYRSASLGTTSEPTKPSSRTIRPAATPLATVDTSPPVADDPDGADPDVSVSPDDAAVLVGAPTHATEGREAGLSTVNGAGFEPPPSTHPLIASPPDLGPGPESSPAALEIVLAQALVAARPAEIERGVTLVGPHRDDLHLALGDLPARGYASHGESWSYALALRLGAFDLLRAEGAEPVLVLDDVFAELDAGRRERLARLVGDAGQLLVTCAVPADVPADLIAARYDVTVGQVRRAT